MSRVVLVTGASGFIGRDLVVRLAAAGWQVRAAARDLARVPEHAYVEPVQLGTLERPIDWRPLLAGATHVVHLAGLAHAGEALPVGLYTQVNAEAVRSLAGSARNAGIERVVLVSSVRAQSGPVAAEVQVETMRPQPTDPYGRSKLTGERYLAETLEGGKTSWSVLRPVLVYGHGVKGNMRSLYRLSRLKVPLPFGALTNRRSILSLANLASAIDHVLVAQTAAGGTFLVADPEPVTVPEIVATLRRAIGRGAGVISLPDAAAGTLAAIAGGRGAWERLSGELVVDISRLKATGWEPDESTSDGLARWAEAEKGLPVWQRQPRPVAPR